MLIVVLGFISTLLVTFAVVLAMTRQSPQERTFAQRMESIPRRAKKADGDRAEANQLLAKSLTPPLIQYEGLQRWDGRLPLFTGGGGTPLIDVSKLTQGAPAASPTPAGQ